MSFSSVIHGVWSVGLGLQILLAIVLIVKGMWRKFPVFTGYTVFSLLETAVAFAVFRNHTLYFYVYLIGETVLLLMGIALVHEIFVHLFSAQPALRKMAALIFIVNR